MSFRQGVLSWAQFRPLGPQTEPKIHNKILIFHTMGGNLRVVDRMFMAGGYDGTESTFGVGGKWSPEDTDGELFQWQKIGYEADAQFAGNLIADSVETADGGNANNPWTSLQLTTLIRLTVDWCQFTKNPCRLVAHPTGTGLGYHMQFEEWNLDHHGCPGQIRIAQLRQIVIPKARALLQRKPEPHVKPVDPHKLSVDGIFGHDTVIALQLALGFRGKHVDGVFGPATRRRLQKRLSVKQDAVIGPITVRAWKHHLKGEGFWPWASNTINGVWDHALTAQLQKALNAHKF